MNNEAILKQPVENDKAIVVNQVILRPIDRTMKDISTWRNAHIAAERIIWPIRQKLYDLYKDVEIDGHLSGIIEKRLSFVLNKKIFFKDAAGKKVEAMDLLIRSKKFRDIRKEIFTTQLWGVSGLEFIPGKEIDFLPIPRKHIKPEYKIIAYEQNGFEGVDYTKMSNIMVMGEAHDLGLLLKCCPYAIWKRGGLADWAQFVEIFGQPVRIFKYDAYDVETKKQLVVIQEESGSSQSLLLPKQAEFEMMDGKTSNANGDLQNQFMTALNNEMSVVILGNTETTTSSSSSGYAQSKQHSKQQLEITKCDLDYEMLYLNSDQFMDILKSYGLPVTGGEFCHEQDTDIAELTQRIVIDGQVAKIVPVGDDYFYDTYQIPKPDNYDELKEKMEQAKIPPAIVPNNPANPPKPANKKPDPKENKEEDDPEDLSGWQRFRMALADFFAPAPRD